jgi:CheY-like chemotaxis protein
MIDKNIPIIAQTAFALTGDKEKATNCGCTDYLSKPISHVDLLEMMEKYLRKS